MAKVDVNQYIKWAAEKPTRSVKIEVENRNEIKVWVYDQEIGTGCMRSFTAGRFQLIRSTRWHTERKARSANTEALKRKLREAILNGLHG